MRFCAPFYGYYDIPVRFRVQASYLQEPEEEDTNAGKDGVRFVPGPEKSEDIDPHDPLMQ